MAIQSRAALSFALLIACGATTGHLKAVPHFELSFAQQTNADAIDAPCKELDLLVKAQVANGQLDSAEAAINSALTSGSVPAQGLCAAIGYNNLAAIMLDSGRLIEAERYAERSLSEFAKTYPANSLVLFSPLHTLCVALLEQRMIGPARQALRRIESMEIVRHEDRALVKNLAATLFVLEQKDGEAEAAFLDGLAAMQQAHRLHSANAAVMMEGLGSLYTRHRRFEEARRELDLASATFHESKETLPVDLILLLNFQAQLHKELAEWHDAENDLLEAMSLARGQPQMDARTVRSLLANYAFVLRHMHRGREARQVEANIAALEHRPSGVIDVAELLQTSKLRNGK